MQLVHLYEMLRRKGMLEKCQVTAVAGASGRSVADEVGILTHICSDFLFRTGTVVSRGSGIWELSGPVNELEDRPADENPFAEGYIPPRHPAAPPETPVAHGFIDPTTRHLDWRSRSIHLTKVVGRDVSSMVGLMNVGGQSMRQFETAMMYVTPALALKDRTDLKLEAMALMVRASPVSVPASIRSLFLDRDDFEQSNCGREFVRLWMLAENGGVYPDFSADTMVWIQSHKPILI